MKDEHIFLSNGRVQIKCKSTRTLIFGRMVVHKEKINERESYIFVECSFANKEIYQ